MEFEYPFGNWAVPGKTGEPVPGEGAQGNANTFSFGNSEASQGAQPSPAEGGTQEYNPISVEIVTEEAQKKPTDWKKVEKVNQVLYGIAGTLIVETVALVIAEIVLSLKTIKAKRRTSQCSKSR